MSIPTIFPGKKLAITASKNSSKHDFDFLVGGWKIRNRKLKNPLAGCDEWDAIRSANTPVDYLLGRQ